MILKQSTFWLVALIIFITSAVASFAQEEIFFIGEELGVGARAMSMGGAYVGVADDYSAMYWNPAGLGQIRRMEMNVGFSHNRLKNNASYLTTQTGDETTFSRLNSLGFVFPIPTYQGSLVFGVGYNKIRDFDNTLKLEAFNPSSAAYPNIVMPTYAGRGWTTAITDSLYQTESLIEEGSLNQFSFSGAMEVQKNFFLGATVNFVGGTDDYNVSFEEDDIYDVYHAPFNEQDGIIADLKYWTYEQGITSKFSATNLKIGALYRFGSALRLGATIITPTKFKVKESWTEKIAETYEWGAEDPFNDGGDSEYQYQTPYGFNFGASFKLINILLSGGMEFKDWSQAKFLTEPPVAGVTKGEINVRIKKELQATTNLRLGAEMYVPLIRARLRVGYYNNPSPYKYADLKPKREFYTAGVSLMLDKQVMVDLGLIHGSWKQQTTDGITNVPTLEDKTFDKIVGTLSIRF
ncbi:MAG: hypothetical protein GXO75_20700 [Calditrichaeota bacterium]|nr:hypothetical protein [Calditrichota bacterium]